MHKRNLMFRRHGDLNFFPITEAEYNLAKGEVIKKNKIVLQEGETTGHKHVLTFTGVDLDSCEVKKMSDGTWVIKGGGVLTHEDHAPVKLSPSFYRLIREREINHFSESIEQKIID